MSSGQNDKETCCLNTSSDDKYSPRLLPCKYILNTQEKQHRKNGWRVEILNSLTDPLGLPAPASRLEALCNQAFQFSENQCILNILASKKPQTNGFLTLVLFWMTFCSEGTCGSSADRVFCLPKGYGDTLSGH